MKKEAKSYNSSSHTFSFDSDSLKRKIVILGDAESYRKLKLHYMDVDAIEHLLPWALIMANKFNYRPAYFDVYTAVQGIDMYYGGRYPHDTLEIVDTASGKLAVEYLVKASTFGDLQAKKILDQYCSNGRYIIRQ